MLCGFCPRVTFLSTPSARRATDCRRLQLPCEEISIHALREEGDSRDVDGQRVIGISIHALREEGDLQMSATNPKSSYFYPRPPRGGRPPSVPHRQKPKDNISIHALREEGDGHGVVVPSALIYFYPRPPRGGRQIRAKGSEKYLIFLSTPSARRATSIIRMAPPVGVFLSTPSARRATRMP